MLFWGSYWSFVLIFILPRLLARLLSLEDGFAMGVYYRIKSCHVLIFVVLLQNPVKLLLSLYFLTAHIKMLVYAYLFESRLFRNHFVALVLS